jgi:tetratricopeptide (TPR) repeat protein
LQRGDADAARRHATEAAAADPTLPMPAFVEGLILYNQGAYAAAIAPLTQAAEALSRRTEQIPDVRYLLGDALARQERLAEAERWFVAEARDFPGHVRARTGLAMVRWTMGRRAEAIATVEALEKEGTPEAAAAAAQLRTLFGGR